MLMPLQEVVCLNRSATRTTQYQTDEIKSRRGTDAAAQCADGATASLFCKLAVAARANSRRSPSDAGTHALRVATTACCCGQCTHTHTHKLLQPTHPSVSSQLGHRARTTLLNQHSLPRTHIERASHPHTPTPTHTHTEHHTHTPQSMACLCD